MPAAQQPGPVPRRSLTCARRTRPQEVRPSERSALELLAAHPLSIQSDRFSAGRASLAAAAARSAGARRELQGIIAWDR
ncbi:MAG TPA: hypothetical protein VEB19_01440 [Gemmatimonadaceae bacterium]|nr:hypothetical protein [Gemmatimonadaceae bacterium]